MKGAGMNPPRKPFGNQSNSARPTSATATRNTPFPRGSAPSANSAKREITHEMIAKRAYEIHMSGKGGSQDENWHRAERELKAT
jgi:hypothetical protein